MINKTPFAISAVLLFLAFPQGFCGKPLDEKPEAKIVFPTPEHLQIGNKVLELTLTKGYGDTTAVKKGHFATPPWPGRGFITSNITPYWNSNWKSNPHQAVKSYGGVFHSNSHCTRVSNLIPEKSSSTGHVYNSKTDCDSTNIPISQPCAWNKEPQFINPKWPIGTEITRILYGRNSLNKKGTQTGLNITKEKLLEVKGATYKVETNSEKMDDANKAFVRQIHGGLIPKKTIQNCALQANPYSSYSGSGAYKPMYYWCEPDFSEEVDKRYKDAVYTYTTCSEKKQTTQTEISEKGTLQHCFGNNCESVEATRKVQQSTGTVECTESTYDPKSDGKYSGSIPKPIGTFHDARTLKVIITVKGFHGFHASEFEKCSGNTVYTLMIHETKDGRLLDMNITGLGDIRIPPDAKPQPVTPSSSTPSDASQ